MNADMPGEKAPRNRTIDTPVSKGAEYLAQNRGAIAPGVLDFPRELDDAVARRKLKAMGVEIDSLSREQEAYLGV